MPEVINTVVISDGRPGHFNQSKGVLFLLQKRLNMNVRWVDVHVAHGWLRWPMEKLLNANQPELANVLVKRFFKQDVLQVLANENVDLVISAGGNTRFINAIVAHNKQAKSVFLGTLRRMNASLFGRVITALPIGCDNNIVTDIVPVPIDDEALQEKAAPIIAQCQGQRLWALFCGGDGAGFSYSADDWKSIAVAANAIAAKQGIRWLISTSPRTGRAAEAILKQHMDPNTIARATWYSESKESIAYAYMGAAERIYCTADSMTMLMESVTAKKPVTALITELSAANEDYQVMLKSLEKQRFLEVVGIAALPAAPILADSHFHTFNPQNWLDQLVAYLAE